MKYTTKLISHEHIAEDTMAFQFEKPAGFEFMAGQHMDLGLTAHPTSGDDNMIHTFSFTTAPHEDHLAIATRMRDSQYKNALKALLPGAELSFDGPFGNFLLHEKTARPAVMLVGGIGITPFISMIKDALHRNTGHTMYLFYSNRRPEDTAFLKELQALSLQHKNFILIPTMTDMDQSAKPWEGETERISKEMFDRYAPDRDDAVYYTAGPAGMVAAMRALLNESGVSNDDIRTEEFSGY